MINTAASPFKFNNNPSGFYAFNNTSVRTFGNGNYMGFAFPQFGGLITNFALKNNIFIGVTTPAQVDSELFIADIDYNGWSHDGTFVFFNTWNDLAGLQANSPYEANGYILNGQTFANGAVLPANYTTFVAPFEVTLDVASNAVDAALLLPNINDNFTGAGPDTGAWERGTPIPVYGVRIGLDTLAPAAPTDVTVE